jgi:hypothetical protein
MNVNQEITLALQGLRDGVITPCEAADRVEALLGLGVAGGRPPGEAQIRLRCDFYVPGPGLCGWDGPASEAGWCNYFEEYICPQCASSDGLHIIEDNADLAGGGLHCPACDWRGSALEANGGGCPECGEATVEVAFDVPAKWLAEEEQR